VLWGGCGGAVPQMFGLVAKPPHPSSLLQVDRK
jgi:hypothetical protein